MTRSLKLLLLFCFLTSSTFGQQKGMTLLEYFEKLITSESEFGLDVKNVLLLNEQNVGEALISKKFPTDDKGNVIIEKNVSLRNVPSVGKIFKFQSEFYDKAGSLYLSKFHFKGRVDINVQGLDDLTITNCVFENGFDIRYDDSQSGYFLEFSNNDIYSHGFLRMKGGTLSFNNNFIYVNEKSSPAHYYNMLNFVPRAKLDWAYDSLLTLYDNVFAPTGENENLNLFCSPCQRLSVYNNEIRSTIPNYFIKIGGAVNDFSLLDNQTNSSFFLHGVVSDGMKIGGNSVDGYYIFNDFKFPQDGLVDWEDVGDRISIRGSNPVLIFGKSKEDSIWYAMPTVYTGYHSNDDVLNKKYFNELLYTYKLIHSTYVSRGNLEDANNCFVALKDLESVKLKAREEKEPSFGNWIRYRLNRLMKFYTNQGTDPALAIQISVYIILLFSFIYLFFPSDWDLESKSKLWQDMKNLKALRGKIFYKSSLYWLYLLVLTLANAFTLSLNVFVTLGFGNIPTHGAARYLCIVEGFLGWFFLSLFSVALINQILF